MVVASSRQQRWPPQYLVAPARPPGCGVRLLIALDEYRQRLGASYWGEVYGEAFHDAIGKALRQPEQAQKFALLRDLDGAVQKELLPALRRLGSAAGKAPVWVKDGARDGSEYARFPWLDLMAALAEEMRGDVEEYATLEKEARSEDRRALHFLTEHQRAALAFVERELAGRPDDAIEPVGALLEQLRAAR